MKLRSGGGGTMNNSTVVQRGTSWREALAAPNSSAKVSLLTFMQHQCQDGTMKPFPFLTTDTEAVVRKYPQRRSQVVFHASVILTQCFLTAVIAQELVYPKWRFLWHEIQFLIYFLYIPPPSPIIRTIKGQLEMCPQDSCNKRYWSNWLSQLRFRCCR